MTCPILNAEEFNNRHNQFLREMRQAIDHGVTLETIRAKIGEAQRRYAAWMKERGVLLDFETPAPKELG